jgi:hypothetical protein
VARQFVPAATMGMSYRAMEALLLVLFVELIHLPPEKNPRKFWKNESMQTMPMQFVYLGITFRWK